MKEKGIDYEGKEEHTLKNERLNQEKSEGYRRNRVGTVARMNGKNSEQMIKVKERKVLKPRPKKAENSGKPKGHTLTS